MYMYSKSSHCNACKLSGYYKIARSFTLFSLRKCMYRVSQKFVPLLYKSVRFSTIGLGKEIILTKVVSFNIIYYFHTCCAIF